MVRALVASARLVQLPPHGLAGVVWHEVPAGAEPSNTVGRGAGKLDQSGGLVSTAATSLLRG